MASSERDVPLPQDENIYDTECPILWAMRVIGQKWKLPILWYIRDKGTIRYNELRRKVVGITPTMLTKCLAELEESGLVHREQYAEIPPRVEYSLTDRGGRFSLRWTSSTAGLTHRCMQARVSARVALAFWLKARWPCGGE